WSSDVCSSDLTAASGTSTSGTARRPVLVASRMTNHERADPVVPTHRARPARRKDYVYEASLSILEQEASRMYRSVLAALVVAGLVTACGSHGTAGAQSSPTATVSPVASPEVLPASTIGGTVTV